MKRIIYLAAGLIMSAAPCGAASFSLGNASGAPGETVDISVSLSPASTVRGFDFTVEFDQNALSLDGFSLSSGAKSNGIDQLDVSMVYKGRYNISASSRYAGAMDFISDLGKLRFTIAASAPFVDLKVSFNGNGSATIAGGSLITVIAQGSGTVSVKPSVTPMPTGTPPQVSLNMESPETITFGERCVVRYRITVVDPSWEGSPADIYFAASVPGGALYFLDRKGRLTKSMTPAKSKWGIGDMGGTIDFGAMGTDMFPGRYTFFLVLAYTGTDPRKSANRISDLADAHFDLVAAPSP